jgi:hypothetical protein
MMARNDLEAVARQIDVFLTTLLKTRDRRRCAMGLLVSIVTLVDDDRFERLILADALRTTASELDPEGATAGLMRLQ